MGNLGEVFEFRRVGEEGLETTSPLGKGLRVPKAFHMVVDGLPLDEQNVLTRRFNAAHHTKRAKALR